MAFHHGRDGFFEIDDSGGTPRDISSFLNNVDFARDVDTPETTTYSVQNRTYVAGGLTNATFSCSGFWDPTATTGPDDVLGSNLGNSSTLTFTYGPEGNTTGDIKYTGECILTSYSISSPVDGVISFTADFQITAAITRTTF